MAKKGKKAWKDGYRSIGGARRFVFRHLKAAGFEFDGYPKPTELVAAFEKYHTGQKWSGERSIRDKLMWAAEHCMGFSHLPVREAPYQGRARSAAYNRQAERFLRSDEWYALRQIAFEKHGRKCMKCKITDKHATITVDHIKSRKDHPELALELSNLQILCRTCNSIKGNRDDTDWREPSLRVLMD